MKEKILYINHISPKTKSGGSFIEYRNLEFLRLFAHVEVVGVFRSKRSLFGKIFNVLFSKSPIVYTPKEIRLICKKIKQSDIKIVFIDNSLLGYFSKYAKKHDKKVITYFHNCEYVLSKGNYKKKLTYKQEKMALVYSDLNIILSYRDLRDIQSIYQTKNFQYEIVPTSLPDRFVEVKGKPNIVRTGLFIGSFFGPNIEAVRYIVKYIAPKLSDTFIQIVGKGFETFEMMHPNVEFIGGVEDLDSYINRANFMLFPILSGSGMKVKTSEALMFGKKIIGSKEAFSGYDINNTESCVLCNDVGEYIEAINQTSVAKTFYMKSRELYLEKYSDQVVMELFKEAVLVVTKAA